MKNLIYTLAFLMIPLLGQAQNVNIKEDDAITRLVDAHRWSAPTEMEGWSLQLITSDDRALVEGKKKVFLSRYPGVKAVVDYQQPYYRLKVGAFLSKQEADMMQKQLRVDYPDVYIVLAKFPAKDLLGN